MPDWSYHPLFKPLLFALPAKFARQITLHGIQAVQNLPGGRFIIELLGGMKPSESLRRVVAGVEFPSMVGMSGLVDPNATATAALSHFGFGFVIVGPIKTTHELPSQVALDLRTETITYHPDIEYAVLEPTIQRLSEHTSLTIPRIIHAAGEKPEHIIRETVAYADAFILEGSIEAYEAAKQIATDVPIFYYLSYDSEHNLSVLRDVAGVVDGIFIDDRMVNGSDIVFGRQVKNDIVAWLEQVKFALPDVPVMCCAGIYEPQDALDVLRKGADLIVIHSGLIFSGPGLPKRINEAVLDERRNSHDKKEASNSAWITWFLMGLGVLIAGLIALALGLSNVIVSYDENFLGISRSAIIHWNPRLFHFMSHDRVTLAGIMISAGYLYSVLAFYKVRRGERWAVRVFKVAGIWGFLNVFYFLFIRYLDILHLIYNVLILPLFVFGWILIPSSDAHVSKNRLNTSYWFTGLIGQLIFVILGVGVLVAGITISLIGSTYVYIETDIRFLGTTSLAIQKFNEHLTPLIAHDRAGLGGALISEGVILLLMSLWGYREGERWLWWGYCLGGFAALVPAIGIHFLIGYETFSHLLPAYVACMLFLAGLAFSYKYLCNRSI